MKRKQLLYYATKYAGQYNKIKYAVETNEPFKNIECKTPYVCIGEDDYPDNLYLLKNPPFVLFYEGDIKLLKNKLIGIVGSRDMSDVGKSYCDILMQYLNKEYITLSGLAKGVDGYIHQLSIQERKTIGVIGCGLNVVYPKENKLLYEELKKNHLILSEYPYDTKPLAMHFPLRNRIIAALINKLVVVEATIRSGTMLTVNEALLLNKDIYCFPSPFIENSASGCNMLIQEGADILVDVNMIKEL
ncbi:DNA processing protein [Breznakia sp. PF5-3]|uniref:DNA-processing protein DprA n=1 Tax=unclassified Breznakia TaxID=2623764 RepID=UPI00240751AD|nr:MULTISPECIES: DNA-processing protein DprA [unclassified Breznakia]MDL2276819.1 DNA-protecting protein DprA [Breznakia sp. OttesenSCG-928-G09]MDF9824392.1 DNA processing protein [Breznakia sp. PM6-1]MDF9835121.1 DNA processing protein [Breznakia sp. PF5-3]MDF9838230.1 DNA processing protein [Breznakia sp. PFB2-8]MDF9860245.1 DNA processing protein [Breznakia sp. PH5-24]